MSARRVTPNRPSTRAAELSPANPAPRILVVDDDRDILRFNSVLLKHQGYGVDTAADGADALEALDQKCYDLLLTDHRMPGITGLELIRQLRAAQNSMPVILVSGLMPSSEVNGRPWLKIGALLHKPYNAGELLATVANILGDTDAGRDGNPDWPDINGEQIDAALTDSGSSGPKQNRAGKHPMVPRGGTH